MSLVVWGGETMRKLLAMSLAALVLGALCPACGLAQEQEDAYEKRVLFAPLQVPSAASRDDGPSIFLPAFFRPPVPWLKLDDRYESFMADVEIQAELEDMEKLFLNPFADLSSELTAGIKTEIGAHGEMVRYYEFAGGKFEFSSAAGPYGRPGSWGSGYDYDSWLGNSNRSSDAP
jgi:hypothetical protein